jgi:hypothetical protein
MPLPSPAYAIAIEVDRWRRCQREISAVAVVMPSSATPAPTITPALR